MFTNTISKSKQKLIGLTLLIFVFLLSIHAIAMAADALVAARVWPSKDYTRITLESSKPFTYKMQIIENPDRVVLDIENIELNQMMKSFNDKILPTDPYIKQVRVAKFQQNTVRLVVDLKNPAKANAFTLKPMSFYQHRLVLDISPLKDPILEMLAAHENKPLQNESMTSSNDKTAADATTASVEANTSTVESQSAENTAKPAEVKVGETANSQVKGVVKEATIVTQNTAPTENIPSEPVPSENRPSVIKPASDKPLDSKAEAKAPKEPTKPEEKPEVKKYGRQIIIAIDAGHGGEDPGARGANGSREKDITLMIAKKLKEKVDAEPNMKAVLTRDGDFFIPLHGRVVKARAMQADLFISIHADSFTNQSARGSSVFALSEKGATSASARYLAKKENESDLIGGVSLNGRDPLLARTLLDLSQTATINDSLKLGKSVLNRIGEINTLHTNHVEQAGFAVLKSPDIPSILVETAFISNPEEERKLNNEVYQIKLVSSILSGIKKYFASNPALAKTRVAKQ
ncbi:MAG: N-acetylmuramoyl-L-alanine amidase [Methylophilaceae bacterium]